MKRLKRIRVVLAALFLACAVAYVCVWPNLRALAMVSERMQIIPSALSVTLGATLVWLTLTFLMGRVYCSTACPVGTLLDCGVWLRRRLRWRRVGFRYRERKRARLEILVAYAVCVAAGVGVVPMLIEPWHIFCNLAGLSHLTEAQEGWMMLGIGGATGIVAGAVTAVGVLLTSLWRGRDFCTVVCPVGTVLGAVTTYSFYHIEIDPDKCINCMECEERCPSSCIKVVGRYVDDTRCVRCFECTACCPNDAIRYQINRNRPATPLFSRRVESRQ